MTCVRGWLLAMLLWGVIGVAGRAQEPIAGNAVLGVAIESSDDSASYCVRAVDGASREALFRGTHSDCVAHRLQHLIATHGTGRTNVRLPTLGGKQFWADEFVRCGWRVQRHVWTGHHRLLDDRDVRCAWGSFEACRVVCEREHVRLGIRPASRQLVVLVHGLMRSKDCFAAMADALREAGYEVLAVNYPSSRGSIGEHAQQLDGVMARVQDAQSVSFVTHSLGGLVVRELLALDSPWQQRLRLHRVVMLGPPNRGSVLVDQLGDNWLLRVGGGAAATELASAHVAQIPAPTCAFAVLAGGTGGEGYNPLIPGDDDLLVSVENIKLEGMADFLRLDCSHRLLMKHEAAIAAAVRFLRTGSFAEMR